MGELSFQIPQETRIEFVNQAYEHPSNPKTKLKTTEMKSFRDREFLFDQKPNVANEKICKKYKNYQLATKRPNTTIQINTAQDPGDLTAM